MSQIIKEGSVELLLAHKPENYWLRNKKPKVDLLRDNPFGIERQLEDQRLLMEKNRNPQLDAFTKVDKLRSDKIAAKQGAARDVAVKANVVNKIVREATGIHNFTIVAPPKFITHPNGKMDHEKLEPETNPRVKPYAEESKSKPIMCSFGHRPSSASRTFHPATMKFRLKHGEILPSTDDSVASSSAGGKKGKKKVKKESIAGGHQHHSVGLPVAVLAKVLHAGPVGQSLEQLMSRPNTGDKEKQGHSPNSSSPNKNDSVLSEYEHLFFTKEQQEQLLYNVHRHESVLGVKEHGKKKNKKVRHLEPLELHPHEFDESVSPTEAGFTNDFIAEGSVNTKNSWISSAASNGQIKIAKSTLTMIPPINHDDREPWDEGFHRVKVPSNEIFQMRASGINVKQEMPLGKLLHRFNSLTFAENQFHPFCTDKQELDKLERSGIVPEVPKSVPVKGQPLYYDPWDVYVKEIKKHHKTLTRAQAAARKVKSFQDKLDNIPKVKYFPTTRLREMLGTTGVEYNTGSMSQVSDSRGGTDASRAHTNDTENFYDNLGPVDQGEGNEQYLSRGSDQDGEDFNHIYDGDGNIYSTDANIYGNRGEHKDLGERSYIAEGNEEEEEREEEDQERFSRTIQRGAEEELHADYYSNYHKYHNSHTPDETSVCPNKRTSFNERNPIYIAADNGEEHGKQSAPASPTAAAAQAKTDRKSKQRSSSYFDLNQSAVQEAASLAHSTEYHGSLGHSGMSNGNSSAVLSTLSMKYPNWSTTQEDFQQSFKVAKQSADSVGFYETNIGTYLEQYNIKNKIAATTDNPSLLDAKSSIKSGKSKKQ